MDNIILNVCINNMVATVTVPVLVLTSAKGTPT